MSRELTSESRTEEVLREKLLALAALQKVDVEIAAVKKSADTWPKQIAELDKDLGAARSAVDAEKLKLTDLERQRATLEMTIAEDKDKVKKWEARLTEQRSTREYSALAREIDIAKKSTVTMSEDLTEMAKLLSAQRDVVKAKDTEFQARTRDISDKMNGLKAKLTESEEAVKNLEGKRGDVAKHVDAGLLKRYDVVRKKRMPAMAALVHPGTCTGCRMNIPPQMYNTLATTLGYDVCPSCQRIIHVEKALEAGAK